MGIPGDRIANYSDGGQVWAKPLSNGSWAVILYNPNFLGSIDIAFTWDQIPGWPVPETSSCNPYLLMMLTLMPDVQTSKNNAVIRDLWKHMNEGKFSFGYRGKAVAPHAVRFLTVTPM